MLKQNDNTNKILYLFFSLSCIMGILFCKNISTQFKEKIDDILDRPTLKKKKKSAHVTISNEDHFSSSSNSSRSCSPSSINAWIVLEVVSSSLLSSCLSKLASKAPWTEAKRSKKAIAKFFIFVFVLWKQRKLYILINCKTRPQFVGNTQCTISVI